MSRSVWCSMRASFKTVHGIAERLEALSRSESKFIWANRRMSLTVNQ